jgi:hypothetical protein
MNKLIKKYGFYMHPKQAQSLYNIFRDKYYTGIGSRETPEYILSKMIAIAEFLAYEGYILRSGGAEGADTAFEQGCDKYSKSKKEIYLPWFNFNGNNSPLHTPHQFAFKIARQYHPYWHRFRNNGVKKLMARNVHQIMGQDLQTPSDFVIGYTLPTKGGTIFGLSLAKKYNIPTLNLFDIKNPDLIIPKFMDFYEECKSIN